MSAGEGIAIVGLAVRFPGADSVEAFWRNLRDGVESVTFFSDDELRAAGVDPALLADPRYVKANGVLRDADKFDAAFFGMNPREAEVTDPQHRVFLECAWEALERAGCDAARTPGRVGVFAGAGLSTYLLKNLAPNRALVESVGELALILGNNKDFAPTRVSYKLNLRGPSVAVNSACSTSLVAVHLACQSLLDFHCDLALAGGVSVQVPQAQGYLHQEGGIASADGHCRAFDARRARHGERQRRRPRRAQAAGRRAGRRRHDPRGDPRLSGEQRRCGQGGIHRAERGGAGRGHRRGARGRRASSPAEISYVEAHGTGTELGDPIEVAALTEVFGDGSARAARCALGSVKTNFGHLDEAAGVAGLIKTVLALRHRELPASLHYTRPNPKIDFARSAFTVNAALTPWAVPAGAPRRAGVSSFGIGGTNAHVVLEEAPLLSAPPASDAWQLLVLSARTPTALARATENLANWLESAAATEAPAALADVAVDARDGPARIRPAAICRRTRSSRGGGVVAREPKCCRRRAAVVAGNRTRVGRRQCGGLAGAFRGTETAARGIADAIRSSGSATGSTRRAQNRSPHRLLRRRLAAWKAPARRDGSAARARSELHRGAELPRLRPRACRRGAACSCFTILRRARGASGWAIKQRGPPCGNSSACNRRFARRLRHFWPC